MCMSCAEVLWCGLAVGGRVRGRDTGSSVWAILVTSSWLGVGVLKELEDPSSVRVSKGPLNAKYLSLRNHTLSLSTSTSSM